MRPDGAAALTAERTEVARRPSAGAWLRPTRPEAVVLGLVLLAGLVHLLFPFRGDQALFTTAAEGMRHGDRLYVDFWDVKQPGIFLWYLVAGVLFGYREPGVHLAEVLYLLAFSRFLQVALRPRFTHHWVGASRPMFNGGPFYAAATAWELTQVEVLVAFPLAVCAWSTLEGVGDPARRRRFLLAAGLAAAAVTYFKLMYLGIVLAFWAVAAVMLARREGRTAPARAAAPLLAGLLGPWLALLAYFAAHGIVGEMWWTYVTYPPRVLDLDPRPTSRLTHGLSQLLRGYGWLLPLTGVALLALTRRSRDGFHAVLASWFVAGSVLLLLQNWWDYNFVLLVWPVGIMAALGLDALWSVRREVLAASVAVALLTAALAAWPAREVLHKLRVLASDDFALTAEGRRAYTDEWNDYYPYARDLTAFLREPGAAAGPIHVIGNPVILYLSGRDEAMPLNGWAPEQADAKLWRRTRDELVEYRPTYLYVDDFSMRLMRARSPATLAVVEGDFCPLHRTDDGRWYAPLGTSPCEAAS